MFRLRDCNRKVSGTCTESDGVFELGIAKEATNFKVRIQRNEEAHQRLFNFLGI